MRGLWIVCAVVAAGFIAWAVWPAHGGYSARKGAHSGAPTGAGREADVCMSNLHALGASAEMYATDHEGRLPVADRWSDEISDYMTEVDTIHCPAVSQFGYAFNLNLGATRAAADPATSLIYDSSNLVKNATDAMTSLPSPPRHTNRTGERANLSAFADGHAGWLRP